MRFDQFLRTLKLIDDVHAEIEMQEVDFLSAIDSELDSEPVNFKDKFIDTYNTHKKGYIGFAKNGILSISRRATGYNGNLGRIEAKGTYEQIGDRIIIKAKILGLNSTMKILGIGLALIYALIFYTFLSDASPNKLHVMMILIPVSIIYGLMLLGIPYFMAKKNVSMFKFDLEREFYYLTKFKPNELRQ